jgi:hypothetical protein
MRLSGEDRIAPEINTEAANNYITYRNDLKLFPGNFSNFPEAVTASV